MDPVVWLPVAVPVAEVDHDAGWLTRVDLEIPPWKNPPITESKATGTVSKCACSTQEECPLQTKHISETSLLHQEKQITDHMHVSTVSHESNTPSALPPKNIAGILSGIQVSPTGLGRPHRLEKIICISESNIKIKNQQP